MLTLFSFLSKFLLFINWLLIIISNFNEGPTENCNGKLSSLHIITILLLLLLLKTPI